jgi:hypothetical protein
MRASAIPRRCDGRRGAKIVSHPTTRPDCASLFLTDGYKDYMTALLTHFGAWLQLPRQ